MTGRRVELELGELRQLGVALKDLLHRCEEISLEGVDSPNERKVLGRLLDAAAWNLELAHSRIDAVVMECLVEARKDDVGDGGDDGERRALVRELNEARGLSVPGDEREG